MKPSNTPDIATATTADSRPAASIESLLDDRGQTRTLRRTLAGIVAGVVVLIAWATLAEIDELARARGEVQPGGHVQVLQSEQGGTIATLNVSEGDSVVAGQVIAEFAPTDINKLRTQTDIRLNALAIDRERMLAVLEDREPDFSSFEPGYPLLVQTARVTFREQLASRDAAIAAKRSEGNQQSTLISGAESDRRLLQRELSDARERLNRLEEGVRRGVITPLSVAEARQQVTSIEERISDSASRAAAMRSTLQGVDAEIARVRADFNQQLSQELNKTTQEYRTLQAERQALEDKAGRIEIKAPVDGVVMNLPQTAVGAVVPPGGTVAEVVPSGRDIVMDVMVQPRDIGFVKEGQRASVKIDSFDSARFGSVEGRVIRVAPTSTHSREGAPPFYRVEIALATPFVGTETHRITPGMTGEADIATGQKSVMQYLLKPVFLASDTAFSER